MIYTTILHITSTLFYKSPRRVFRNTMEPITASICIFFMTGGMIGVAMYEHNKIIRYIKIAEKKQLIIEKLRKDITKGK